MTALSLDGSLHDFTILTMMVLICGIDTDSEDSWLDVIHTALLLARLHISVRVDDLTESPVVPLNARFHLFADLVVK